MADRRAQELILDRDAVAARASENRVEESPGVYRAILWEHDGSSTGLLWLDPGARMDEHVHEEHEHHVWVIHGRAEVLGQTLDTGSYWYVPPGRPHALAGLGPAGCQLFYCYLG